jgi:hypothetical protein
MRVNRTRKSTNTVSVARRHRANPGNGIAGGGDFDGFVAYQSKSGANNTKAPFRAAVTPA